MTASSGWRWLITVGAAGVVVLLPSPASVRAADWALFAVFIGTIVGFIARPAPMSVVAFVALAMATVTKLMTPQAALSGLGSPVAWLIVSAFLFARAVARSGLGERLAFALIARFGGSPLRLAYTLAFTDLLLAPFIPSDTARAGGIVLPIIRGIAATAHADDERSLGAFLVQSAYLVGVTSAAMFVTAMSANPLILELARTYANVDITWARWAAAASVPGLIAISLIPFVVSRVAPPRVRDTTAARERARAELAHRGPMSRNEIALIVIFAGMVAGWVAQPWHGLSPAIIALCGLAAVLALSVLEWTDALAETRAWDVLVWFGVILAMAQALADAGVVRAIVAGVPSWPVGTSWIVALVVTVAAYTFAHYAFASMTAHITTLYPPFLLLAIAGGVPPIVAALSLAFFSNINASLTHFGSGSAPVLFGAGYVTQAAWWRAGLAVTVVQLVVWLGGGLSWWRVIGLY